jgi:tetratricopeptide (TPR) repeat protein
MTGNRAAFEAAVKRGHGYAWEEQWMKAIEQYKLAVAEFPDDATARSGLAFAYHGGERLKEALREYRKLRELSPEDADPRAKMARVLEELGRSSDAAEAWRGVADLHVQQKSVKRAVEAWKETLRLQPADKEARYRLAEALERESHTAEAAKEYLALARSWHQDGDPRQASVYCRRALSLDPGNKAARGLLERMASANVGVGSEPSLSLRREELGPVVDAVRNALGTLAEALLGDGQLVAAPDISSELGSSASVSEAPSEVRAMLAKAVDLQSRGEIEQALVCYKEVLAQGVARTEIEFSLGLLNKQLFHYDEAVGYLQRCLEASDYALASHLTLGESFWAQGRTSEALNHFLGALRIIDLEDAGQDGARDLESAYRSLAASGWGQGGTRDSELLVHSLAELLGGGEWRERVKEARSKLDSLAENGVVPILPEVLDIPGGDEVVDMMTRSREYLRGGMPFTALEECYRAVRLAPTYLPVHLVLAEVFAQQGKAEEAVSKYAAVAEAYLMRDDQRKAMDVYRRALVAAPMSISVREKLIDLLTESGELSLALEEYVALGESYYRLARVDAALERYEQALSLASRIEAPPEWRVNILHRVADLHMQRVHWKEAASVYERILKVSPDDEQAVFRLLELRYRLGQERLALAEVDALIVRYGKRNELPKIASLVKDLVAANPQDASLRSRLSRLYVELGMKREAIAELDTLGELQLEAGRRAEAMETLRTIISLEPDEKEGYTRLLRELQDRAPGT